MTVYAIGDVQGCYTELKKLLAHIHFDELNDTLWFTGDLVNRGPHSLEVLRFIKHLGKKTVVVLGNHDLHLLAIHYGVRPMRAQDTFAEILAAEDRPVLMDWLRGQPLFHYDPETNYAIVHAGLAPTWNLAQTQQLAREVEKYLRSETPQFLLQHLYGNDPALWRDDLQDFERLRCITNYLTRLRLCHADGRMDFTYNGTMQQKPPDLVPWFDLENRMSAQIKIIFGHWAALGGQADVRSVYPLDTGCVWGNCLTALRLTDAKRFSVKC